MINQSKILSKTLTISVILLFIGVGIQPAIAINSIEPDNSEHEEITIQFFETDRTYNHTVMLSREQIEELEDLIDDFEIRMDNADNRLETEAIYKDIVVSLNDIGILPESMSIEKAQRLVTGKEHNPVAVRLFERLYERNQGKMGDNENILCSIGGWCISGIGSTRGIMTITAPIWNYLYKTIFILGEKFPLLEELFHDVLLDVLLIPSMVWVYRPFGVGFELFFGGKYEYPDEIIYFPNSVEISTLGLNGKKTFKGKWYGHLPLSPFIFMIHKGEKKISYGYPGAVGFTGIKIPSLGGYGPAQFLFGSALWVKLGEEPPLD